MQNSDKILIDVSLVGALIAEQFPQCAELPVKPVELSGWDNRTFHLGEHMIVRLPSAACYSSQAEAEQYWLPKLAPLRPLPIPAPIAMDKPTEEYPCRAVLRLDNATWGRGRGWTLWRALCWAFPFSKRIDCCVINEVLADHKRER